MIVRQTFDPSVITQSVVDNDVWPHVIDDGSVCVEDFTPVISENQIYLECIRDGVHCGVFVFSKRNAACIEAHSCMNRMGRGKHAYMFAEMAIDWIWCNTKHVKIVAEIAETNKKAIYFAQKIGMKKYGLNRKSWVKNGVISDSIMFEIIRPSLRG